MSNKEEVCHYESFSVGIIYMTDDSSKIAKGKLVPKFLKCVMRL